MWKIVWAGVLLALGMPALGAGCNEFYCTEETKAESHQDVYIRSIADVPVLVTIKVAPVNALPTRLGDIQVTVQPRQRVKAFRIIQTDQTKPWSYTYETSWQLVMPTNTIQLLSTPTYRVPLPSGLRASVLQGFGGSFSHNGEDTYAIDLDVPEGTPVLAARGGVVVNLKADGGVGGPTRDLAKHGNFVIIQHPDGTFGRYYHLKQATVVVRIGQTVVVGQQLALSGNTGFTKGPHLHFDVAKLQGARFVTIPFILEASDGRYETIATGISLQAK